MLQHIRRFLSITLKVLSVGTFLNILLWVWLPRYVPLYSYCAILIEITGLSLIEEETIWQCLILISVLICIFLFLAARSLDHWKILLPAFLPIYFVCEIVQLFLVSEIGQLAELICSNLGVRLGLIVFNSILLVLTCVYCGSMWKNERKLRNTACSSGCMQDHLGDCDSNNTDTDKEDLDDIWGESAIMRYIRRFLFITLKVLSVSTFLNILVWSWLPEYVPLFSISAMLITLLSVIWMVEYPVLQSVILASILICIFLFFAAKSIERHKTRLLGWLFIYYLIEIFYLFPVPETGRIAELIIPNWGMRLCLTLLNSILLVLTGIYGIGIKESQW